MTDLSQKIRELEAKHKEQLKVEKAKLMAKYRAVDKKRKDAENKQFLQTCLKYRKLFNDDNLLFGGLQHIVNTKNKDDAAKLDYFRGLIRQENNQM